MISSDMCLEKSYKIQLFIFKDHILQSQEMFITIYRKLKASGSLQ